MDTVFTSSATLDSDTFASAPLDGMSDEQLCAAAVELERAGRLMDTARLRVAAELAHRSRFGLGNESLAFRLGHGKAAMLVEALTLVSPREAARRIRLGESIRRDRGFDGVLLSAQHPRVGSALEAGEIGVDAAEAIVRNLDQAAQRAGSSLDAAGNRDVAERELVETARHAPADEVAVQARAWREALDPDGAEPRDEQIYRRRSFILGRETEGMRSFHGTLVGVDAALLQAAFDEAEKPGTTPRFLAEGDEARGIRTVTGDDGEPTTEIVDGRTRDQRRYDIFAGLITAGVRASGNAPVDMRSTAHVSAVITLEELERGVGVGWIDGADEPVAASTVRELVCANGMSLVVMGENGEPLYLYRGRRYFSEQQMRALAVRDGGCVWPGCHSPAAWADGHHVVEFSKGGPTNIDNGVLLCPHHHRMLHRSDFEMRMIGGRPHLVPPAFIDEQRTPILVGRSRIGVNLALQRRLE
ncbi:hypothetical protein HD599_000879 [Conyzicola lurida]|uniref:HNH nuclease domain-containing protein n=1 Tax=Conyzicola lurida TaxID=1172621 RepID=A0A841ALH2_9MICO|nr:HNH endonuclease signature motif containing protein [Conyzicola lurida]MBB5842556.1 hypothetical protein [Conyzicola lurida]